MTCDLTKRKIKRILFQIPTAVQNNYPTAPSHLFEDGWLRIHVLGVGEWKQTTSYIRSEPALTFASRFPLLNASRGAREFQGTVKSCRAELYWMLYDVAEIQISTNWGQATPITIRDYATPETSDVRSHLQAQTEPYTERAVIMKLSEVGPIVGQHGNYRMPDGFTFNLLETSLRTI